jgi:hypothetical protein
MRVFHILKQMYAGPDDVDTRESFPYTAPRESVRERISRGLPRRASKRQLS